MGFDPRKYPPKWRAISRAIRDRAAGRCECAGECGHAHEGGRCAAAQGDPTASGWRVILTVAHLWRGPCRPCHEAGEKCGEPAHLKAMCQRCHLAYDLPHHIAKARHTRHARKATGDLFQGPPEGEG